MIEETIEEVARRIFGDDEDGSYLEKRAFIKGAKWQQEKMYNDMQEYAEFCIRCYEKGLSCIIAKDWFKQFKNI
jgi:hypothetical protein